MNIFKQLDLNIIGKFKYLSLLIGMDISSDNDVTIINSELASDMFNIVCDTKNLFGLKFAVEKFRNSKLPFAYWIGFDDDHPECKKKLEEFGYVCDERESAMFAEINKLSRNKKCNDLKISIVDTEQKLVDFIAIYRDVIPNDFDQIKEFYTKAAEHIFNPKSLLKLFVGYFQAQPVATSALFMDENAAGVWDVVTAPRFRRKGIGTDVTTHALFYASDNYGYRTGVLTASSDGEPVYRKIGFQKLKDFYVFNIGAK